MATKNSRPPQGPPPPAALTMPLVDAQTKLTARIEKGEGLRQSLAGGSAEEEYKTWDSYNHDLLARMFTDRSVAQEYAYSGTKARTVSLVEARRTGTWGGERIEPSLSERLNARVAKLRSIRERLEVFDGPAEPAAVGAPEAASASAPARRAFIVHGHDGEAREATARVLGLLGVDAVILHEQPNEGRTILEKFEKHSADASYAIVLLTADDVGGKPNELHPRARQNVILELGFFWGSIGRARVCVLYEPGVELPSDLHGLVRVEIDAGGGWRYRLAAELRTVWPDIDLNRLHR